jgi:hypothetical protein
MTLSHARFDQIDESQLQRLVDAQSAEARDIEYKRQTYGGKDIDRAEFLADISSFANTAGGDLLIGIDAKGGIPLSITPITGDADSELLRLEEIARSGLAPRISNLVTKAIPISAGGKVLLFRIPKSYARPHRVIRNGPGNKRFWARSSNGKYEPNVEELRALFNLAPQLADQIRDFRMSRIAKIVGSGAPVRLLHDCRLVMHLVPFSAFNLSSRRLLTRIPVTPATGCYDVHLGREPINVSRGGRRESALG